MDIDQFHRHTGLMDFTRIDLLSRSRQVGHCLSRLL